MLCYVTAIAAASKKRYPDRRDRDSFTTFVQDENKMLMPGGETIYIPATRADDPPGEHPKMTMAEFLYEFVRCTSVHEATLAMHVRLSHRPLLIQILGCWVELGVQFFDGLDRMVANAPEASRP